MFANSKKQTLAKHSLGVANLAVKLFDNLDFSQSSVLKQTFDNVDKLKEDIFLAGLLHDIGKADPNFQKFLSENKANDAKEPVSDGVHFAETKEKDTFSFLNYPRHNEVSWAISSLLLPTNIPVLYAVYFHHAKVKRVENKKEVEWSNQKILNLVFGFNLSEARTIYNDFFQNVLSLGCATKEFESVINHLLTEVKNIDYSSIPFERISPRFVFERFKEGNDLSLYLKMTEQDKESEDLKEIKNLLVRSLIVSADRIISSLSLKELDECIEDNYWSHLLTNESGSDFLSNSIENMLDRFSVKNENSPIGQSRDSAQKEIAKKLSEKQGVSTLFGPAGCGKTKIFLEWYRNKTLKSPEDKNKKLYIIAPRKMICSSLFYELSGSDYIPEAKIELITGDSKKFWDGKSIQNIEELPIGSINSEIVITTIDQLISVMLSHKKIDALYEFLNSYVIFDEFHEFFNLSGIILLFKLFIKLKKFKKDSKTLLVSATPNYYLLNKILGVSSNSSVEYIDTFNKEQYDFVFSQYEIKGGENNQLSNSELYETQKPGSIVIFNTAKEAQSTTISVDGEDVVCFHSKFTGEDKQEIYETIKKNWGLRDPGCAKILRAGPIVQASLNISTMNLITQVTSAENWCQRIGRANRFASNIGIAKVTTVLSDKTCNGESANNPEAKFLEKIAMKEQSFAWVNFFINKNFPDGLRTSNSVRLTLSQIYEQYKEFHNAKDTEEAYDLDFNKILLESFRAFSRNDFTPFEYWKAPKKKGKAQKMSSVSLRGSSVFVLPVCYDIYSKQVGNWLYIPSENTEKEKLISISEEDLNKMPEVFNYQICVLSAARLNFPEATYAKVSSYSKMNPQKIKLEAKNSTSPLLLSYTSDTHDHKIYNAKALFYVTKGKVKVGLYEISIK